MTTPHQSNAIRVPYFSVLIIQSDTFIKTGRSKGALQVMAKNLIVDSLANVLPPGHNSPSDQFHDPPPRFLLKDQKYLAEIISIPTGAKDLLITLTLYSHASVTSSV
ncbi:hypothetical protein RRG08_055969 [Elysia crispata]|uniref:Uncharacterized protein n=1 Tax=Elysia crispata TaxID=231223 RepID=A0AAE1DY14_9GAST|nr:hypothetical protein RRG08_055969 [Elysia crispata]